jgi:hypothetical protein
MEFDRLKWLPNYNKNFVRARKKNIPATVIILLSLAIIAIIFLLSDMLTLNQATVLGVAGSTIFAIAVFFLSDSKLETQRLATARNNARVLSQILDHISNELSAVSNGHMYHINYPQNWLSIYSEVASYLEYDYLSALIKEFAFIDIINEIVLTQDSQLLKDRIQRHWQYSYKSWHDFPISDIKLNLGYFSCAQQEREHWTLSKRYRDFYDNFIKQYSNKVHDLTITFLTQHGGWCEAELASNYVANEIRRDSDFLRISGQVYYDRELLLPIFHIHQDAEKDSNYMLGWGQLSLKNYETR